MNQYPKYLRTLLEANGFVFKRAKGSHQIYYNMNSNVTIIVPVHGNKDIKEELSLLS